MRMYVVVCHVFIHEYFGLHNTYTNAIPNKSQRRTWSECRYRDGCGKDENGVLHGLVVIVVVVVDGI